MKALLLAFDDYGYNYKIIDQNFNILEQGYEDKDIDNNINLNNEEDEDGYIGLNQFCKNKKIDKVIEL